MLKVCVIGCGMMFESHRADWERNPEARIVSVVDIDEERARSACEAAGAEKWHTDYRAALEDDIDVVDIALPHHLHVEVSVAASTAGKHVLCEKPMACVFSEGEAMCRAAEENGVKLGVRNPSRADRSLKDLIEQGRIGRPYFASAEIASYLPNSFFSDEWPIWGWMKRREFGGGVLSGPGPHAIDYLIWLVDSPVAAAYGVGCQEMFRKDFGADCDVEDTAIAVIRFESGAVGSVTCSWKVDSRVAQPLRIVGDRGALVQRRKEIEFVGRDGESEIVSQPSPEIDEATSQTKPTITDLFVRWILHNEPYPATGVATLPTIQVLDAVCGMMRFA